ncbi:alpha/beta hydrolase [Siminovitchia acidinfaciens]|uniref:Alpha/beta hydrolase n=1 Tax=Siminovitchia acidinfaciens TaxID=2321395 RepID=A0A429Y726_9BACI|nr:alpha/beta hydrolase [Siminovitchia acidinfaciens]RST77205.1 alpha/beta hydrolase [Siminovitchia acidinfaciens]
MGQYVTTKKGRTFYIHETPGEQGTIIGSHGLTGNHKQLRYYQEALSGYRFISYDILGRGNSDTAPKDSSIDTHADDLLDLVDSLEIEHPILLGYSMGAYISAIAASRMERTEALILLDGAGEANEVTRQLVLPSLDRLKKTFASPDHYAQEAKKLYTSLGIDWGSHMEEVVRYEIKEDGGAWRNKSDPDTIARDFESFYTFQAEDVLARVNCPVFLLTAIGSLGDKGPLFKEEGYARTKETAGNIRTAMTSANHYELVFNPQPEINGQLDSFLSQKEVKS